jgi:nucleoside-diphosphate-sugar epimerase
MNKKTALVAGATGIIGSYIMKHLSALEEWNVIGLCRTIPERKENATYLSLNLLDYADCVNKLQTVYEVTHIFYAAYQEFPALSTEQLDVNTTMLSNIMHAVEATSHALQHVVMMQGAKVYGAHLGEFKTPAKESDPRHMPPNFYYMQEDFLREHQLGKSWSWTILRPDVVAGVSIGNPMNLVTVIGVYASISKELGLPLRFPGKKGAYHALAQVTDASLLARASVWVTKNPLCAQQVFNVTNGDFFRWDTLWPKLAKFFDMEYAPLQTISLTHLMPLQKQVWERLVARHGLNPLPYEKMAAWPFGDFIFGCEYDVMSDTTKIKQFGFHEVMGSEDMLLHVLRELKEQKLLP